MSKNSEPPIWLATLFAGVITGLLIGFGVAAYVKLEQEVVQKQYWVYKLVPDERLAARDEVEKDIKQAITRLNKENTKQIRWNDSILKRVVDVTTVMERRTKINHKDIIAIMIIESDLQIYAWGKNRDRSTDHGLTQQNSFYIKQRYIAASKVLTEEGIYHDMYNKYDIALNIAACFMYLVDSHNELGQNAKHADVIKSYNVGRNGVKLGRGGRYYEKFVVQRKMLGEE